MSGTEDQPLLQNKQTKEQRYTKTVLIAAIILVAFSIWPITRLIQTQVSKDTSPFGWQVCRDDPHYLCGSLTLPLDYHNHSDPRTVTIATTLYQPRPGHKSARTLVIEPGGPGGSGTNYVWRRGTLFSEWYTNNELDVLGFDPRGVNLSTPAISCYSDDAFRDRWAYAKSQWPETRGLGALYEFDALMEAEMKACKEQWSDIPRFLTTASVARDVDEIRKALGENHLTAYMVSYGTGIGQTYAQMFPDKVGHVALDGMEFVVDGREPWQWAITSNNDVISAFEDGFIGECATAGDRCALAHGQDKDSISKRLHQLFNKLKERPVPGVTKTGAGLVTYERLVEHFYEILYKPITWREVARDLAALEKGNATALLINLMDSGYSYNPGEKDKPKDKYPPDKNSLELTSMVICMLNVSWMSATPRLYNVIPCRHYDYQPVEVYRGGFDHKLHHPLLLISTPFDPATPLENARRLAKEMGKNARLLISNGYGHSSNNDKSDCSNKVIRDYIMHGKLPDSAETFCEANKKPFDEDYEFSSLATLD